jgi:hypothetical protein
MNSNLHDERYNNFCFNAFRIFDALFQNMSSCMLIKAKSVSFLIPLYFLLYDNMKAEVVPFERLNPILKFGFLS